LVTAVTAGGEGVAAGVVEAAPATVVLREVAVRAARREPPTSARLEASGAGVAQVNHRHVIRVWYTRVHRVLHMGNPWSEAQ